MCKSCEAWLLQTGLGTPYCCPGTEGRPDAKQRGWHCIGPLKTGEQQKCIGFAVRGGSKAETPNRRQSAVLHLGTTGPPAHSLLRIWPKTQRVPECLNPRVAHRILGSNLSLNSVSDFQNELEDFTERCYPPQPVHTAEFPPGVVSKELACPSESKVTGTCHFL